MVIEHSFVTTLAPSDAMQKAHGYLAGRGFFRTDRIFGPPIGEVTALEMRRGKTGAARAKDITDLPQLVRLEWDRGQVSVALSINAISGLQTGEPKMSKMQVHQNMLEAIAAGLEELLAYDRGGTTDYTVWDGVEQSIKAAARRRSTKLLIVLGVIIALTVAVILLAILAD
jgi:hypothetical protein